MNKAEEYLKNNGINPHDTIYNMDNVSNPKVNLPNLLQSYHESQLNKMPSCEEIEKTIRETLVIINKESVKYAIDKIKKLYKN